MGTVVLNTISVITVELALEVVDREESAAVFIIIVVITGEVTTCGGEELKMSYCNVFMTSS